jgi:hypothetical protein
MTRRTICRARNSFPGMGTFIPSNPVKKKSVPRYARSERPARGQTPGTSAATPRSGHVPGQGAHTAASPANRKPGEPGVFHTNKKRRQTERKTSTSLRAKIRAAARNSYGRGTAMNDGRQRPRGEPKGAPLPWTGERAKRGAASEEGKATGSRWPTRCSPARSAPRRLKTAQQRLPAPGGERDKQTERDKQSTI